MGAGLSKCDFDLGGSLVVVEQVRLRGGRIRYEERSGALRGRMPRSLRWPDISVHGLRVARYHPASPGGVQSTTRRVTDARAPRLRSVEALVFHTAQTGDVALSSA